MTPDPAARGLGDHDLTPFGNILYLVLPVPHTVPFVVPRELGASNLFSVHWR